MDPLSNPGQTTDSVAKLTVSPATVVRELSTGGSGVVHHRHAPRVQYRNRCHLPTSATLIPSIYSLVTIGPLPSITTLITSVAVVHAYADVREHEPIASCPGPVERLDPCRTSCCNTSRCRRVGRTSPPRPRGAARVGGCWADDRTRVGRDEMTGHDVRAKLDAAGRRRGHTVRGVGSRPVRVGGGDGGVRKAAAATACTSPNGGTE